MVSLTMYLLSEVTSLHYFHFKSLIRDLYEVNIGECSCADVVDEVSSDAWVLLFGCMLGVACNSTLKEVSVSHFSTTFKL